LDIVSVYAVPVFVILRYSVVFVDIVNLLVFTEVFILPSRYILLAVTLNSEVLLLLTIERISFSIPETFKFILVLFVVYIRTFLVVVSR